MWVLCFFLWEEHALSSTLLPPSSFFLYSYKKKKLKTEKTAGICWRNKHNKHIQKQQTTWNRLPFAYFFFFLGLAPPPFFMLYPPLQVPLFLPVFGSFLGLQSIEAGSQSVGGFFALSLSLSLFAILLKNVRRILVSTEAVKEFKAIFWIN